MSWISDACDWVGDRVSDVGEGIGNAASWCKDVIVNTPSRIKEGWESAGLFFEEAGNSFSNGAWVAGIGHGIAGTFAGLGAGINTVTGGSIVGISHAIFKDGESTYEDGTFTMDRNAGIGNKIFGGLVQNYVNSTLEIDEAIEEGDIDKANKIGGQLLAREAVFGAGCAAAVVAAPYTIGAIGAGSVASIGTAGVVTSMAAAGVGVASNMAGSAMDAKSWHDTYDDNFNDLSDAFVQKLIAQGVIKEDDKDTRDVVGKLALSYLHPEQATSKTEFYAKLRQAAKDGDIDLSEDYLDGISREAFRDVFKADPGLKEYCYSAYENGTGRSAEGQKAADNYYERMLDASVEYAMSDKSDKALQDRNLSQLTAGYLYEMDVQVQKGEISKEYAEAVADASARHDIGLDNDETYVKKTTVANLEENTGFTKEQIDIYADYYTAVQMGDMSEDEFNQAIFTDTAFAEYITEDGQFVAPIKEQKTEAEETKENTTTFEKFTYKSEKYPGAVNRANYIDHMMDGDKLTHVDIMAMTKADTDENNKLFVNGASIWSELNSQPIPDEARNGMFAEKYAKATKETMDKAIKDMAEISEKDGSFLTNLKEAGYTETDIMSMMRYMNVVSDVPELQGNNAGAGTAYGEAWKNTLQYNMNALETSVREHEGMVVYDTKTDAGVEKPEEAKQEQTNKEDQTASEQYKEWKESLGDSFNNFATVIYNKILSVPVIGYAIAKTEAVAIKSFGLSQSVAGIDVQTATSEELANAIVDRAKDANEEYEKKVETGEAKAISLDLENLPDIL